METMKSIGREFHGFDSSLSAEMIAFPKLKMLYLWDMYGLGNWELPIFSKDKDYCPKLEALPPCLGKQESLEVLWIHGLECIQQLDLGTSNDDKSIPQEEQVLFPKLRELNIEGMDNLERWSEQNRMNMTMSFPQDLRVEGCPSLRVLSDLTKFKSLVQLVLVGLDESEGDTEEEDKKAIGELHRSMPDCFTVLSIEESPKLNKVSSNLFSPTIKEITIVACPELSRLQGPPPLLRRLSLKQDCGGYSKSIPIAMNKECSITHFTLWHHPHAYLPEGLKEFKALQELNFVKCEPLDFELSTTAKFCLASRVEDQGMSSSAKMF